MTNFLNISHESILMDGDPPKPASNTQKQAMKKVLDLVFRGEKEVSMTGPAGSGKTSIIHHMIARLEAQGRSVVLVAPTNMAAKVLNLKSMLAATYHSVFFVPVEKVLPSGRKTVSFVPYFDDLSSAMLEYMPRFVSTAEIDSISVTVRVKDIIDHRLYEKVGFASFDEYATKVLEKPVDWFSRVAEVAGPIGKTLAEEKCERIAESKRLVNDEGMSLREAAKVLNVNHQTVANYLSKKDVLYTEIRHPKRNSNARTINLSKEVERASVQIREKFGEDFALALKQAL